MQRKKPAETIPSALPAPDAIAKMLMEAQQLAMQQAKKGLCDENERA